MTFKCVLHIVAKIVIKLTLINRNILHCYVYDDSVWGEGTGGLYREKTRFAQFQADPKYWYEEPQKCFQGF